MIAATLAQHLGLAEAIARVVDKVASCPQCFTFWVTMSALLYLGHDVYASALSAIVVASLRKKHYSYHIFGEFAPHVKPLKVQTR